MSSDIRVFEVPEVLSGMRLDRALLATGFGLWRVYAADPVPSEDQSAFQSIPRTSAVALGAEEESSEGR